jgi:RHS repeat-associated protein
VLGALTDGSYVCPQGETCDQDQAAGQVVDNSYGYDANGNQVTRTINGVTLTLSYDAQGHIVSVSGPSLSASFVYDGDGKRVKSTINGETTYFVGNYYEQTGTTITKYYYAGSQRVAMRVGNTAYYLLTDHLGSTSLTTDSSGNVISELRYTAWGSVKYQAGSSPSDYTFTGQYGYDFGLMYFNARWLDVDTAHFAQADSLIPGAGQSQAWDRYAYSLNNPLLYIDPTGHDPVLGFLTGFLKELARTNFWWHPGYQKDLVIQKNESTSELTGRLVADVASMVIGVIEVGGGTGAAGGGIAVCATGIGCPGGFLAIAGGGALIAEGAGTALNAAYGGGTILAMLSHVISNQSEDQSSDPMGNFRVSSEFEKRMKDWGLSDKEILNVLKNGKKFTDPQGQFLLWDPKSKLAIVVDKIDGELVTVYEQPKLPRTWKTGWLEEFGE